MKEKDEFFQERHENKVKNIYFKNFLKPFFYNLRENDVILPTNYYQCFPSQVWKCITEQFCIKQRVDSFPASRENKRKEMISFLQ